MRPLSSAIQRAYDAVRQAGVLVEPTRWQSVDVSKRPEAATWEILNHTLKAPITSESLVDLREACQPSVPWADEQFAERVGGVPVNPGPTWHRWPWANSADKFRVEEIRGPGEGGGLGFSHTYAERLWPKHAMRVDDEGVNSGIRYNYGDLEDVVNHLATHPDSRQAFVPLWFPEDTGKTEVRVPCTLGWHFIHRKGFLHCTYYIRSVDLYRHFRDDVYMAVRLQLWMLDRLRGKSSPWLDVRPGIFTMHMVSLHCFVNDARILWGDDGPS